MASRQQPWLPAVRQGKVVFPSSACGAAADCISAQHHTGISSGLRRRCASTAASLIGLLRTRRQEGRWQICPAGSDCGADAEESVNALLVAVDPGRFALAAAEDSALEAHLNERLSGYDQVLLDLARTLALESAEGYPNGPLYWKEVASGFIGGLVARHTSEFESWGRGTLGKEVLERLRDYVVAHLDELIEVALLADIAGRSPFHFSRVFTRSVGVTPHRWIVHLRSQQAIELVHQGQSGLAEIAARTGFADQSHLSRWVRRVYGVPLTQLAA
jgi:AraC family transcriptional regulator